MGLYAAAVVLVPLGLGGSPESGPDGPAEPPAIAVPVGPAASLDPGATTSEQRQPLDGLWWRYEPAGEGERVRFYYFHEDGTGIYRYGRVGLTYTHSFDYEVRGDVLVLDFRKTGEHHEVRFTLEAGGGEEGRDWLELHDDPEEAGSTRYYRESGAGGSTPLDLDPSADLGPAPAGHMWIDLRRYATGGQGFSLYQLRPAGIDGRGVGWFHRGDFDEWSTESMTYRIVGGRIELRFALDGRLETSPFSVTKDAEGSRWLALEDDPRDYWHAHRYMDLGPSFGAALAPADVAAVRFGR